LGSKKKTLAASNTCKDESSARMMAQPEKAPPKLLLQSTATKLIMRSLSTSFHQRAFGKVLVDNRLAANRRPPAMTEHHSEISDSVSTAVFRHDFVSVHPTW
jgi:hypothetical protein